MSKILLDLTTTFSLPIPEAALKPQRSNNLAANALPFKEWFTKHETAAAAGEAPVFFVPTAWFAERADKPETVDGAYVQAKVREQFNKWVAETKVVTTPEVRSAPTKKTNKNGKEITIAGKVVTAEVATNEKRGQFILATIERTGKEKDAFPEGGPKAAAGVHFWLLLNTEARKAVLAAKEAAEKLAKAA